MNDTDLQQLASSDGCLLVGSEKVQLISPLDKTIHHMNFDRAVCAAGLKRFVRPILESDLETNPTIKIGGHMLIVEEKPGQRLRIPAMVIQSNEMN
jgi:hypothetical protein